MSHEAVSAQVHLERWSGGCQGKVSKIFSVEIFWKLSSLATFSPIFHHRFANSSINAAVEEFLMQNLNIESIPVTFKGSELKELSPHIEKINGKFSCVKLYSIPHLLIFLLFLVSHSGTCKISMHTPLVFHVYKLVESGTNEYFVIFIVRKFLTFLFYTFSRQHWWRRNWSIWRRFSGNMPRIAERWIWWFMGKSHLWF